MDASILSEKLNKNINELLSPSGYKNILNRGNNLIRFDVLNRMLIEMQGSGSFDLKTEEEWLIENRQIRKKEKPIYIIMPRYESSLIDTQSGEVLGKTDLSTEEVEKAIEYNIIERVNQVTDLYTLAMYDIRQTINQSTDKYVVNKPVLDTSSLLDIITSITNCSIEICDEDYYSLSENTIFLKKDKYYNIALLISNYLAQYFTKVGINKIAKDNNMDIESLSESEKELIQSSIEYSLETIFIGKAEADFEIVSHMQKDKLIAILNIVDMCILEVVQKIKFTKPVNNDAISSVYKIRKAEVILNIMEANDINNKMKGI